MATSFNELERDSPAEWAARKAAQGCNVEHLEVMNLHKGLDDHGWYFRSKLDSKQHRDLLETYLPEAKRRGIAAPRNSGSRALRIHYGPGRTSPCAWAGRTCSMSAAASWPRVRRYDRSVRTALCSLDPDNARLEEIVTRASTRRG